MHGGVSEARGPRGRNPAVQADGDAGVDKIDAHALGREVMPAFLQYPTRGYRVRMSTYWWLGKWPYLKFILRELSSIFVAWFVIEMLLQIRALNRGPQAYAAFLGFWKNPLVFVINVV